MTIDPSEGRHELARLRLDRYFEPCPSEPGDELYPNGIFEFNISRLIAFIGANAERFPIELVGLAGIPDYGHSNPLDENAIEAADLSRPILLAEIAPDRYNLIDGHHRVARARRGGIHSIPAYRLRCPEHVAFLTSIRAYQTYVGYWNDKVDAISRAPGVRRWRGRSPQS
jgi:ParB/Sulfiredoxin domain